MNAKEQPFFKQHFEKLLLALAVLFLLAIGYFFVANQPFTAELAVPGVPISPMSPVEIEETLSAGATTLRQRLSNDNAIKEKPQIPDYGGQWKQRFATGLTQNQTLAMFFGGTGVTGYSPSETGIEFDPYFVPTPPMPTVVAVNTDFYVLDFNQILDAAQSRELRTLIGNQQPADFTAVSVLGSFPLAEWERSLERDHDAPAPFKQLERGKWEDKLLFAGVYLLRQELNPATDQWGEAERVPLVPGVHREYFVGVDQRVQVSDTNQAQSLLNLYADSATQQLVRLAPMPPLANNQPWFPPGTQTPSEPEQDPRRAIDDRPADDRDPQRLTPGERREQRQLDRQNRGDRADDREAARREALEALRRQAAGEDPPRGGDQRRPDFRNPDVAIPGLPPVAAGRVQFWVHDLTAKPGKTYRYKPVVNVANPLFGEKQIRADQEQENFRKMALGPAEDAIQKAQWSEPVKVRRMLEFFVIDGQEDRPAKIQIWKRFDGQWKDQTFTHFPGDPIGADQINGQIDMRTGAIVVDILTERDPNVNTFTHRLLYVEDDQMRVRDINADRTSESLQRLKDEQRRQQQQSAAAVGGGF